MILFRYMIRGEVIRFFLFHSSPRVESLESLILNRILL